MERAVFRRCKCGAVVRLVISGDGTEFWRCLKGHQNGVKKHSESYKENHSKFMKEVLWQKEGHRETIAEATRAFHTGRKQTKESNRKRSAALKGEKSWLYGKSGSQHPMFGKKNPASEEKRFKISRTSVGRNNSTDSNRKRSFTLKQGYIAGRKPAKGSGRGKGSYCLKGHWVRSTWEREVADWLFLRNIQYEYEAQRFDLGDGTTFLPDFYLPEFNTYYEVKGYRNPKCEKQFRGFRALGHSLHVLDENWFKQYAQLKQKELNNDQNSNS